uniref:Chromate resistance regulatory protein n=1 Tax=Alishewanella sp. HW16 TaxID=1208711 RepID=I6YR65_9ALTE|nr:chromate resistance regulatory protein [Alishewanella sp. HW16]
MNTWLVLVISLPTENATARMRAWRALKASGAAVLRDGVYLLPNQSSCRSTFDAVAADVVANGGSAYVLSAEEPSDIHFQEQFDRGDEYAHLLVDIQTVRNELTADTALGVAKQIRKLRKAFTALMEIDFFPGEAQKQADAALVELEVAVNRVLSPNEPHPVIGQIPRLKLADYQGKTWATRRRPWVDRLASAWLIRRFIDCDATILWLTHPADCPNYALGFDFDDAIFSHVGAKVTFEVLLASFGLDRLGLQRIGALVHYLDVGGVQPPESVGIESVLAGLRETITDDDQLLTLASGVFDGLLVSFEKVQTK